MANTNEKLKKLKEIHSREESLYVEKNEKYGDSFSKTFEKRGYTSAIIRLEDKLSRVDHLLSNGLMESNGESVIDTLMDLSNYANMTIMELMESGPSEDPAPPRKKRSKKKDTTPEGESEASEEKGPMDDLSKRQLVEIISQLGGTVPKKANRKKLYEVINQFPKAKVAVAITSLKAADPEEGEETGDGEEE